jgi:hypothetical protein
MSTKARSSEVGRCRHCGFEPFFGVAVAAWWCNGSNMGSTPPEAPSPRDESPRQASPEVAPGAPEKRDRLAGFSILGAAFCAALVISWKASDAVKPNLARHPAPPTSEGLTGYPSRVDPVETLALARQIAERDQLRRIIATGVGVDGTIDLEGTHASARYEFDSAMGEGPEPPRAPGTVRQARYCGRQSVQVTRSGIFADPDQPRAPCRPRSGEPLPEPRCTPKQLWARALERRAPSDARATIEYYRAQEGPAWRFSIPSAEISFTLFGDCERELTGKAARAVGL